MQGDVLQKCPQTERFVVANSMDFADDRTEFQQLFPRNSVVAKGDVECNVARCGRFAFRTWNECPAFNVAAAQTHCPGHKNLARSALGTGYVAIHPVRIHTCNYSIVLQHLLLRTLLASIFFMKGCKVDYIFHSRCSRLCLGDRDRSQLC